MVQHPGQPRQSGGGLDIQLMTPSVGDYADTSPEDGGG